MGLVPLSFNGIVIVMSFIGWNEVLTLAIDRMVPRSAVSAVEES